MNKRTLSPEQLERLAKLAELPDDQIDTSDIREMTDEEWANARRYVRPVKQPVTIRLDADVVVWFRQTGRKYQTRINQVLRRVMEEEAGNG